MGGGGGGGASTKSSRSQRKHTGKFKGRNKASGGLMLTSMLDILTCVLFFLLKNYSTVVSDFSTAKDIQLPSSTSLQKPQSALQLVVTQKEIILDDKPLLPIVNGEVPRAELYRDGVTIVKLAQALKAQKDRSLYVQQNNDTHTFSGVIVMQADKNLQFNLLKKIIYTAGISDFNGLKLAVLRKDEG